MLNREGPVILAVFAIMTSAAAVFDLGGGAWVLWQDDFTIRGQRLRLTCGL